MSIAKNQILMNIALSLGALFVSSGAWAGSHHGLPNEEGTSFNQNSLGEYIEDLCNSAGPNASLDCKNFGIAYQKSHPIPCTLQAVRLYVLDATLAICGSPTGTSAAAYEAKANCFLALNNVAGGLKFGSPEHSFSMDEYNHVSDCEGNHFWYNRKVQPITRAQCYEHDLTNDRNGVQFTLDSMVRSTDQDQALLGYPRDPNVCKDPVYAQTGKNESVDKTQSAELFLEQNVLNMAPAFVAE